MAVELSEETARRLEKLFAPPDRASVADLLVRDCGDNLPFCENSTPASLERIRFSVLKLSAGDSTALLAAIKLAQVDWRDLLMASGFAHDVTAHSRWRPP